MQFLSRIKNKAVKHGDGFTAFDAMKFFAVFSMTTDHIGAYFFPDEYLLLRATGRIAIPVWFFLVGYSRSRDIGKELWLYAILLIPIHVWVAQPIFPTNALITVILCRLALNFCTDKGVFPRYIPQLIAGSFCLLFITEAAFEYGATAFLFTLLGRCVRESIMIHRKVLVVSAYSMFIFMQYFGFDFTAWEFIYVILGTAWVVDWLNHCSHRVIWKNCSHSPIKNGILLLSRNTMPYYFYHRALFQVLAAWMLGHAPAFIWINL